MGFQWSDFCVIAQYLLTHSGEPELPEEAAIRCAVSRAYYAAFRHALNYAKDNGDYTEPQIRSLNHKEIRKYFKKRNNVRVSIHLERLHQLRKEADYEDAAYNVDKKSAKSAISEAKKVLQLK